MSKKQTIENHSESPYLAARREWNERYGSYIAQAKNWRVACFISLAISVIMAFGLVALSLQKKIEAHIVTLDKSATIVSVNRLDAKQKVDDDTIKSFLARWIVDTRSVVMDGTAQRQMIDRTYSMLSNGTRALQITNEFFKKAPPNIRSASESVEVEVSTVMFVTDKTWQVEWEETTRNIQGIVTKRVRWKANLGTAFNPITSQAQLYSNPIGLYITDLSWSQVL